MSVSPFFSFLLSYFLDRETKMLPQARFKVFSFKREARFWVLSLHLSLGQDSAQSHFYSTTV